MDRRPQPERVGDVLRRMLRSGELRGDVRNAVRRALNDLEIPSAKGKGPGRSREACEGVGGGDVRELVGAAVGEPS